MIFFYHVKNVLFFQNASSCKNKSHCCFSKWHAWSSQSAGGGQQHYAVPQESRQFRSCPYVTSHSCCPLSSPGLEQRVASLCSDSHLFGKDKIIDMRVNISLQKCSEQPPQTEKWQPRSPRSNVTAYADNLPCLWYVLLLHQPQTCLFSNVAMWCLL